MTLKKITSKNRVDWICARAGSIGASESPALFGEGYSGQTPLSIWHSKRMGIDGVEPEEDDSQHLKIGRLMEPVICRLTEDWLAEQFALESGDPEKVLPDLDFARYRVLSNDYTTWKNGVMSATPDGIIYLYDSSEQLLKRGTLEFKNVGIWAAGDWKGDSLPPKHHIQIQHQLAVTGFDFGILAGLIGGNRFEARYVERNEPFINRLREQCESFWCLVRDNQEPPVTASHADKKILLDLHPDDNGETVNLDGMAGELKAIQDLKRSIKESQALIDESENNLRQMIGDATFGECSGYSVSFKTTERKASIREIPAYKYRTLRIKETK